MLSPALRWCNEADEGVVLSVEDIESIGYKFQLLKRIK